MDTLFPLLSVSDLILAAIVAVFAGFVKGVVGFAMPLVFISGLTIFLPPELALAGLIVPTVVTNVQQALRQGRSAAIRSIVDFRLFLICGGIALVIFAQLVPQFPPQTMMAVIGVLVTFFAVLLLTGYQPAMPHRSGRWEIGAGMVAGALGGLSGVWGPPTVAYLTALNTAKQDQLRIQGVIYGLGAVALLGAHIGSGVLRAETIGFSLAMVPPAYFGVQIGMTASDKIDQTTFRRVTLIVLLLAGLNLIRRAWFG